VTYELPWERQPGETPKAWEAFTVYRDLGPSRSLRAAGQQLGKSTVVCEKWSARWDWVNRCREWDRHTDGLRRAAQVEAIETMSRRHADQAQEYLATLRTPVVAILQLLGESESRDAFMEQLAGLHPVQALELVTKLATAAAKMVDVETRARGAATERLEVSSRSVSVGVEFIDDIDAVDDLLGILEEARIVPRLEAHAGATSQDADAVDGAPVE